MAISALFDLVSSAFPREFDPDSLKQYGKQEWWDKKPKMALGYALRKCPFINWRAYILANPDIAAAELDPVWHFLNHGLFEGRKLHTRSVEPTISAKDRPAVSIIVPNHDKAVYLRKSIGSLINQTLKDIEIIIVDDASTDGSGEILRELASSDPRIKLIFFEKRGHTHRARKTGVAASSGRAVMFLDSDDYYAANACETAFNALSKGYDFVAFNSRVLSGPGADARKEAQQANYLKSGRAREYTGREIVNFMYENNYLPRNLWNKIYEGDHCRKSFAAMPDGSFAFAEDVFEALVLTATAKRAAKIDDFLYVYRTNVGVSTFEDSDERIEMLSRTGEIQKPLEHFLSSAGLMQLHEKLSFNYMNLPRQAWLEAMPPRHVTMFFNRMAAQCGIVRLISMLQKMGDAVWMRAAEKFQHYQIAAKRESRPKKIGLLYRKMSKGGAERVVGEQARLLLAQGYDVTLFLESGEPGDMNMPPQIKVVYTGRYSEDPEIFESNLRALERQLLQHEIDLMIIHVTYIKYLLWQLMLIRYKGIPAILVSHEALYFPLLHPWTPQGCKKRSAALKCGDKLVVLSKYDEIFYRNQGIDAQYIANPIRLPDPAEVVAANFHKRRDTIAVFCRLGDETKNTGDCLRILALIRKRRPAIKMIFIGSFHDDKSREKFFELATSLGVLQNIHVTGWVEDARSFIDGAGVLLSCAYHEAFPLSISEAQARGLPCVMYDLPIMIAENNPGVIRVSHGDFKGASREILALLDDEKRWLELSAFARKNAAQFSAENHIAKINDLIENYDRLSPVAWRKPEDYRAVIRELAFYGAHLPPWIKQ